MTDSLLPQVAGLTLMKYHSKRSDRYLKVWRSGSLPELRQIAKTYTLRGPGWSLKWSADGLTGFVYNRQGFHSLVTLTPGRF